jgi:hypothetical protein
LFLEILVVYQHCGAEEGHLLHTASARRKLNPELIDAGMDISGVESSMAVLKDMSRTQQKNIFLISHKDELVSRVNSVLKVVKENGFTNYANDVDIIV